MRAAHTRPLTSCKKGTPCSCGEVVVIDDPSSEREQQRLLWGTTKWTKSYGRRTAVERAYADDKFQVTTFDRKSIYCFGTVKHAFYYTPTIVARNLQVALRWYRDQGQADPWEIEAMCQPGYEAPSEPEPSPDGGTIEGDGNGEGDDPGLAAALEDADNDRPVESAKDDDGDDLAEATSNGTRDLNRAQRRAADRRERGRRPVAKPPKPPPRKPTTPEKQ